MFLRGGGLPDARRHGLRRQMMGGGEDNNRDHNENGANHANSNVHCSIEILDLVIT